MVIVAAVVFAATLGVFVHLAVLGLCRSAAPSLLGLAATTVLLAEKVTC